jgi:cytochrome c553
MFSPAKVCRIRSLHVLIAAIVIFLTGGRAQAGDAAAGKTTFVSICSSCHGMDGIATLDYAPSFAKCQRLDQDDAKLLVSVRDGIGGRMPPWGTYLTEHEILDALAYARTFCKGETRNSYRTPRNIDRKLPTVRALIDRYLEEHAVRMEHTRTNQTFMLRKLIAPEWEAAGSG